MYCYQCEQTSKGTACTTNSVCGKDEITANLQDALFYVTQRLALYANHLRQHGVKNPDFDDYMINALFTTVTNVSFEANRVRDEILTGQELIKRAQEVCVKEKEFNVPGLREFTGSAAEMSVQAEAVSILKRINEKGADVTGVEELITYGIKGAAAYAHHAKVLGQEDDSVYAFFYEALSQLTKETSMDDLLGLALKTGEVNLTIMALLDTAHTKTYGHPEPTQVRITPVKGKALLVSGHDLKDLEEVLKQTEGKGINVYTHGEMLPCHGYPELKKYTHLVGNYGGAWQDQQIEFEKFPGSILMTTNCIQEPRNSYKDRIFTRSQVSWTDVPHVPTYDFSAVIESALNQEGFTVDAEEKNITVGFGHNAVMNVAETVVGAVKDGAIKHFFLIGGCDGAKSGRNYFTDFAKNVPQDCVILTLGCGKYRFNKEEFGDIGGIPRLLDVGQCNDAYSAIQIAVALSKAFDTDVNSLPLSLVVSWFEQKAVAVLLSLLHLGIKNVRLGPTLPAFVTEPVLNVLVEKFGIKPTVDAKKDLEDCLAA
jgi:hydroxylamine reductase